jgi:hypothetical protein
MPKNDQQQKKKAKKQLKVQKTIQKSKQKAVNKAKLSCKAGSDAHRKARWQEYKARNGKLSKSTWTNVYKANMNKASNAHKEVDSYHGTLGWGEREVTVSSGGQARRLDIADVATKRGIEHKTGYISLSKAIQWEIDRDAYLVKYKNWNITWHFLKNSNRRTGPTSPLISELKKRGLKITYETK